MRFDSIRSFEVIAMAECADHESIVSYELMDRVTDLLICSRCFRRNVRKPIRTVVSRRHKPMPVCPECSGKIKPGHVAKVVSFD